MIGHVRGPILAADPDVMAARDSARKAVQPRTAPVSVRERGNLYFAYRPKLDVAVPISRDHLQRLYVVVSPRGRDSYRLIVIPEKRLPAVDRNGDRKSWGFVAKVASDPEELEDELDPKTRLTATRGERHVPAARPAGEAVYCIVRHRNHIHLAYALELPRPPGDVQRALNIAAEGSYIVAVKNPRAEQPPGVGLDERRKARFPRTLQVRFRGRRFMPLDPPDLLDHEGAEIVLVGAHRHVVAELGIRLDPEQETLATAEIFTDLRMEMSLHPVTPLLEGRWA